MAHSLETRVPFLDNDLIDFVLRLPFSYKLTLKSHKILLKDTLSKFLPSSISERPKVGFGPPDNAWYRTSLRPFIEKTLLSKNALLYDYFNRAYVERMVRNHMDNKQNLRRQLWTLLSIEYWLRVFIAGAGNQALMP